MDSSPLRKPSRQTLWKWSTKLPVARHVIKENSSVSGNQLNNLIGRKINNSWPGLVERCWTLISWINLAGEFVGQHLSCTQFIRSPGYFCILTAISGFPIIMKWTHFDWIYYDTIRHKPHPLCYALIIWMKWWNRSKEAGNCEKECRDGRREDHIMNIESTQPLFNKILIYNWN